MKWAYVELTGMLTFLNTAKICPAQSACGPVVDTTKPGAHRPSSSVNRPVVWSVLKKINKKWIQTSAVFICP